MPVLKICAGFAVVLALAGCALPPPDQPAHHSRMGRFLGLVAQCGCTDITPDRMRTDYAKAAPGYDAAALYGYVDWGLSEKYDNQTEICREVCSQDCMVNSVAEKLGGRPVSEAAACLISERDLHLTQGRYGGLMP